jgi:hypothetical protein
MPRLFVAHALLADMRPVMQDWHLKIAIGRGRRYELERCPPPGA